MQKYSRQFFQFPNRDLSVALLEKCLANPHLIEINIESRRADLIFLSKHLQGVKSLFGKWLVTKLVTKLAS